MTLNSVVRVRCSIRWCGAVCKSVDVRSHWRGDMPRSPLSMCTYSIICSLAHRKINFSAKFSACTKYINSFKIPRIFINYHALSRNINDAPTSLCFTKVEHLLTFVYLPLNRLDFYAS